MGHPVLHTPCCAEHASFYICMRYLAVHAYHASGALKTQKMGGHNVLKALCPPLEFTQNAKPLDAKLAFTIYYLEEGESQSMTPGQICIEMTQTKSSTEISQDANMHGNG